LVLGVVLTVVLKAIWSWQGENIKEWGGKAWSVVKSCWALLAGGVAGGWGVCGGHLAVWEENLRTFFKNNL
jgi:hypothetical protein